MNPSIQLNNVQIDDTFAEAFQMYATRIIITAHNAYWAQVAAQTMTGFATSIIACGCEAGIERTLSPEETPDHREGIAVLLFARTRQTLLKHIQNRVGQCVLTCPTTACFSGLECGEQVPLGKSLRYFGDGWQISKRLNGKRYWRIPVMEGEFLCEDTTGMVTAIGGGNFFVLGENVFVVLAACEAAIAAMRQIPEVIMPFPAGIVRAGSKVGSRYKGLIASTNHPYCPTLKAQVDTALSPDTHAVMEIVIDGLTTQAITQAMRVGILAACEHNIQRISAGNYGGKLGKSLFHLHEILA
jgi:formylmethanofuran--tetrahydromethanopterin N-formyltransferase